MISIHMIVFSWPNNSTENIPPRNAGEKKKRPLYLVKDKRERKKGERKCQGKRKPA